jgi:hypothetical protein
MLRNVTRLCTALALFAVVAAVPAAAPAADAVKPIDALLPMVQQLGFHYQRINDNTAIVDVPLQDGSTFTVVLYAGQDNQGHSFFAVLAPVAQYPGAVPSKVEALMKELNTQLGQYGELQVFHNDNGTTSIVFVSKGLPASDTKYLGDLLKLGAAIGKVVREKLQSA